MKANSNKLVKKKILWQAHEGNISGANLAMLEYIDGLQKEFDFSVILPHEGSMKQVLEKRKIPFFVIRQYGWANKYHWWAFGKWMKVLLRSFKAIKQTFRLIKKSTPDIVFTNTLVPFTTSVVAKMTRRPHVWWIHEFGKEDFGFTIGWGYEKWAWKWMQVSSQLIIGNSRAISSKYSNLMPKVKIETIYQPVSWKKIETKDFVKKARFLMFGQIIASKGHKEVIDAIITCKELGKKIPSLHILGPSEDSDYLIELEELVLKNELCDIVKIDVGFFKKENILPSYEILIVASQSEAFGRVIVEAHKAGLHVLVRNCGGAPELINESNGLLYDNQNELILSISGERVFPTSSPRLNYNELSETKKTINILNTLCK